MGRPFYAFLSSSATILAFTTLFEIALFPNLIASSLNPEWSLTIYSAASSQTTLAIMRKTDHFQPNLALAVGFGPVPSPP